LSPDMLDNPPSSSHTNGYLYPIIAEEDKAKRRRLDINPTDGAWQARGDLFTSNPDSQSATAAELPFPSSPALHQLSQSLDSLVARLSEQVSSASSLPNSCNERTRLAWDIVVETESLSEAELASARRVFRGNAGLADEYLSFPTRCRGARTLWLMREIKEVEKNLC
jgi:hypothetical protein